MLSNLKNANYEDTEGTRKILLYLTCLRHEEINKSSAPSVPLWLKILVTS